MKRVGKAKNTLVLRRSFGLPSFLSSALVSRKRAVVNAEEEKASS
jgi:hypothetical protein